MMEKVLIKVYFENEFVGLEVFTDEKKFLRYVERHDYINGKRNYIMEDVDVFKLLGSKVFFKKVLEYFKGVAKVKFMSVPSKRKSFFEEILTTQVESTQENVGKKAVPCVPTTNCVDHHFTIC